MSGVDAAAVLALAAVLGVLVPWLFMRMLVPALIESERAAAVNFAGRRVVLGLGVVWLVWAGTSIVGAIAATALIHSTTLAVLTLAGPLALVAFALGVVDDAYGSGAARGFRGHLSAMAKGRLTTGGLKLIGIGLASLFCAALVSGVAPWAGYEGEGGVIANWALALLAGAAIALTSNFVNLTDLRPGRALKAYTVLAVAGALSTAVLFPAPAGAIAVESQAVELVALLLFGLGPVVAVWRYDLGEIGMLGDAGANPMGAVAGLLIVIGLPLWALVAYLLLMLALNLASERYSFSKVIERSTPLRWLDGLGRLSSVGDTTDSAKSSPHTEQDPE